jgi:hypothetical protein
VTNKEEWDGRGTDGWRGEVLVGIWWGSLSERDDLQYIGLHGGVILKWIFKNAG